MLLQKAAKQQAARNKAILNRTHLLALGFHLLFAVLRSVAFRSSSIRILPYFLLSTPAIAIQFWFEKIGRPSTAPNGDLRAGEDLEAKGLTEYLWDVLYWSWCCTALAGLFGDRAWWAWAAIPVYSIWLAWTTFGGMRQGLAGMAGQNGQESANGGGASNRQKKLEKRGGQKVQYR